MRNLFWNIIDILSYKVVYLILFITSGGCVYYARISSDKLHLKDVHGLTSFGDNVFPFPETYFSGMLSTLIAGILFMALLIAAFKAFSDIHIGVSIFFSILCLIGLVFNFSPLTLFFNTFVLLIILSILVYCIISTIHN